MVYDISIARYLVAELEFKTYKEFVKKWLIGPIRTVPLGIIPTKGIGKLLSREFPIRHAKCVVQCLSHNGNTHKKAIENPEDCFDGVLPKGVEFVSNH